MTRHRYVRVQNPGQCFRLAFEFVQNFPGDAVLIHGYPKLTGGEHAGERYAHAWSLILGERFVVDPMYPQHVIPVDNYYEIGEIDPAHCQRYTLDEARRMIVEHETWGPWSEVPDLGSPVLFAEAG